MLIKRTKPVDDFNLYFQVELIFSAGRKSVAFPSIFHPPTSPAPYYALHVANLLKHITCNIIFPSDLPLASGSRQGRGKGGFSLATDMNAPRHPGPFPPFPAEDVWHYKREVD